MDGISFIVLIAVFVLAIVALNKNAKLEVKIAQLSLRLNQLKAEFEQLRAQAAGTAPSAEDTAAAGTTEQAGDAAAAHAAPLEAVTAAEAVESADDQVKSSTAWPEGKPSSPAPPPARDVEQALASRWFVWIGGLAIAIGGVLFVKYAFDAGWLSPVARCVLGFIAGMALIAGGEYLRRTPLMAAQSSYVPAALSAAGLVIAFGSVYAAYAFYALLPPLVAFAVMAAIALAAYGLSLTQGPLIAALGLLGSYATPTLIPSEDPSAWGFFPYVLIILAASLAVLRVRTWWWLGHAAVAGSLIWGLLWAHGAVYERADALPLGLFGLAAGALALFGAAGRAILAPGTGSLLPLTSISPSLAIGLGGTGAGLLVLCGNVIAADHSAMALSLLLAGTLGVIGFGWLKAGMAPLAGVAGLLALVTLAAWYEGDFSQIAYDELGNAVALVGPGARRFLIWLAAFGGIIVAAGYAGTRWRDTPAAWAGISAGTAILFGALGLMRADEALSSGQWMAAGFSVAALFSAAIWSLRDRVEEPVFNLALGLFVITATVAAMLGLDEAFDRVWLTIAMAGLALVLALASVRLRVAFFGPIAAVVAGFVVLRLLMAHELWFGDAALPLGDHWPLYGYGLPAAIFWGASRLFRQSGYARAAVALEGSALGLAVALVSLELRVVIAGGLQGEEPGLLEAAAHAMAWLGAAYGLVHRQAAFSGLVSRWGARLLLAVAVGVIVFGNMLALNPVVSGDAVVGGVVLNALLLAYLAPAVMGMFIARKLAAIGWEKLRPASGVLSLVLLLAYLTLETKRLFQGAAMVAWSSSDAENYAYSAVWLLSALALFVAGIRLDRKYVRLSGLAVMILVVLKVFLIDLSGIGGLYRIASFTGLGLCLVGIGWLYTRYVQKPQSLAKSGA